VEVYARAFAQPGNTRGGLEWYRALPLDHANALGWKQNPLEMPVLALGGEHRWRPRIVGMLEELATNVSGGSIAESGHWLAEERPVETTEALLAFFAP
jgi:pimeloyl-ACP methyl ester carboxylesterase